MLFLIFVIDKYIIQVSNIKSIKIFWKRLMNKNLKNTKHIAQVKEYYNIFE